MFYSYHKILKFYNSDCIAVSPTTGSNSIRHMAFLFSPQHPNIDTKELGSSHSPTDYDISKIKRMYGCEGDDHGYSSHGDYGKISI